MQHANDKVTTSDFLRACAFEDAGDIQGAIKAYEAAAEQGDSQAQVNLANILDDKIVPNDPERAVYWYERAAGLGNPLGAWNLAMHYRNVGEIANYIRWLRVAADMGDDDAKAELAKIASR